MILNKLLENIKTIDVVGDTTIDIKHVMSDSREVKPASLFVAVKGINTDGHQYIDKSIDKGASAILCKELPALLIDQVCYIKVGDPAKALGQLAANFYDNPSHKLNVIGITGTNGKTTVASLLYDVFTSLGHKCGLISTTDIRIAGVSTETKHTTPEALTINKKLNEMLKTGCEYAFMEVSSHALNQHRTKAIKFKGAVFTNISHDHLDYHNSFRDYIKAKQLLFNSLSKQAFAITNLDDKNGIIITQKTKADVKTYSLRAMAHFKGKIIENSFRGLHLQIDQNDLWCKLTGKFNAYNILAAYATGRLLGKETDELLAAISKCRPPEGRFEHFENQNNIIGIVDYAHTPDAVENVLQNINEIKSPQQQLITVIGCGGDRDKAKRPMMAAITAKYSDKVFFTSDNPRFEDPENIINDMIKGLEQYPGLEDKYIAITNRKEAIKVACITAATGDIVLVAGKGHEKFQEIKGKKQPFDDKAILKELLNR